MTEVNQADRRRAALAWTIANMASSELEQTVDAILAGRRDELVQEVLSRPRQQPRRLRHVAAVGVTSGEWQLPAELEAPRASGAEIDLVVVDQPEQAPPPDDGDDPGDAEEWLRAPTEAEVKADQLRAEASRCGLDVHVILSEYRVPSLADLAAEEFEDAFRRVRSWAARKAQRGGAR